MKRKTAKFTALAMTAIIMISMLCGCSSKSGAAKGNTASADPDSMFQDLTITILPDDMQPADAEEEGWKTSYPDGLCVKFNGFDEEQYARYLSHPNNTQVDPRKAKLGDIWLGYAADSGIDNYCDYTDKSAERSDATLYRMLLEKSRYTIDFNETDYTYDDLIGLADTCDVFLVQSELYQWDYDGRGFEPWAGYSGPINIQEYYLMRLIPKGEDPTSSNVTYVMFNMSTITNGGDIVYCKIPVEKDGVIGTYDYYTRKLFREFLNDPLHYDYLMRDSNYHYEALTDSIYSSEAPAFAVEAASKMIGAERTKELYISILYRLLALQESGFDNCYESIEKYDTISTVKSAFSRAVDIAVSRIGSNNDNSLAVNMSRSPVENLFLIYGEDLAEFTVDEIRNIASTVDEEKTLYKLMNKTAVTNHFLSTLMKNATEPLLQEACSDLLSYNNNVTSHVLDLAMEKSIEAVTGFCEHIYGVDTFEYMQGVYKADPDETARGILKAVESIGIKALRVYAGLADALDAGQLTFDICIFAGDVLFDTESQYKRMAEMKALSDIGYALRSAMYPLTTLTYTNEDITNIQEFVYLGQLLAIVRTSGEYSWMKLVSETGGLAELFSLDNTIAAEKYYDEKQNLWRQLYADLASVITLDKKTVATHYEMSWGDGRGGAASGGGGEGGGAGSGGGR